MNNKGLARCDLSTLVQGYYYKLRKLSKTNASQDAQTNLTQSCRHGGDERETSQLNCKCKYVNETVSFSTDHQAALRCLITNQRTAAYSPSIL